MAHGIAQLVVDAGKVKIGMHAAKRSALQADDTLSGPDQLEAEDGTGEPDADRDDIDGLEDRGAHASRRG